MLSKRQFYLHFRIQHEITVIAPNINTASIHQVADFVMKMKKIEIILIYI